MRRPSSRSPGHRADEVLDLVEPLYEAAVDPEQWAPFLRRVAAALRAEVPAVVLADRRTEVASLDVQPDLDPAWHRAYDDYFIRRDIRRPRIQALAPGGVFAGQRLVPDAELVRSEFYNDFLRPQGFFHIAGGVVLKDADRLGVLRVIRRRGARAFDDGDLGLLRALLPHVGRALRIHGQLAAARARAEAKAEILNCFPTGVIQLDARGRVLACNRAARDVLARRDGLVLERHGLRTCLPGETATLRRLVAEAASPGTAGGLIAATGGATRATRPSGARPLSLLVAPIRRAAAFGDLARDAAVVVLLDDPEARVEPPPEILRRVLGLTPAEARVVAVLARGMSLNEAARECAISIHTARTHLKRVLHKTGAGRQTELVRLVLSGPGRLLLEGRRPGPEPGRPPAKGARESGSG